MKLSNLRHREFIAADGPTCIFDKSYAVTLNKLEQTEFKLDKTSSLVLERIALRFPHENLSPFKGFTKYQISNRITESDEIIHETKRKKIFDYCEKYGLIREISRKPNNNGHDVIFYDLTTQGILSWLDYLRKYGQIKDLKNIKIAIAKSERLLSWISPNWKNLKELLDEDILAKILLISSNVIINTYPKDDPPFSSVYTDIFIGPLRFSINSGYIEHKENGVGKIKLSERLDKELDKLFTFVFIYNIIQNFKNSKKSSNNESKLISLIRSDSEIFDAYSKFFAQIKWNMIKANKFVIQMDKKYRILNERKKKDRETLIVLRKQIKKWNTYYNSI